jgi:DNA-binding response OmpR family regulator
VRALVVEDEPSIAADVARALEAAGFRAEVARDGEAAWMLGGAEDYDLVVLDLGLPKLDGLTVLKRWRGESRPFPVLILSARGDWTEKVDGIEAGADDYLAKPFEMGELVARARGLVRRAAGQLSPVIAVGKLTLDTRRMSAAVDGTAVRLSPLEFRFLDALGHSPGKALSAGELAEKLYGVEDSGDVNAIEALVARLRRKIGPGVVETRRGFGYLLAGSDE